MKELSQELLKMKSEPDLNPCAELNNVDHRYYIMLLSGYVQVPFDVCIYQEFLI